MKSSTHSNLIQWNNYERYCFLLLPILLTTWCINRQVFSFLSSRLLIAFIASIYSPLMVTLITTRIAHLPIVHTVKFWQIFPHSMLMTFYPNLCHETLGGVLGSTRKKLLLLYHLFFFMTYYFNRFYHFASSCERWRFTQKFCRAEMNRIDWKINPFR